MPSADHPLYVALLWHLHQPFYKDLISGDYYLPWVRLHAIKDYYQMASLARAFPDLRLTFNLVPCLLEQVEDYGARGARDRALELSYRPSADLTAEEQGYLLDRFFSANRDSMIEPHPRYRELLERQERGGEGRSQGTLPGDFSTQDFLDLQVWFNLSWFHSSHREDDPFLRHLVQKGRGFSEDEKVRLLKKQEELIGQIIPLYRELLRQGQIDITTSPYYHPILPLLCDTEVAREPSPGIRLPRHRFRHPEDALAQISKALDAHARQFGQLPQGMWPSEGAVSQEMASLVAKSGIRWIASDEEILYRSLGIPVSRDARRNLETPGLLYRPYCLQGPDFDLHIVFRDHVLSDLIGFTYSRWEPREAASDFLRHLHQIGRRVRETREEGPFLATIILDGENAWEYYRNDGRDFLCHLYEGLTRERGLRTTTISDFLQRFPPVKRISRLASGSWINHDFRVWIGHDEDNAAWDLLAQTRDDLRNIQVASGAKGGAEGCARLAAAWEEVYVAEGSDWCWWYGDDHSSGMDEEFDALFRKHLLNVYAFVGAEPPDSLYLPITRKTGKTHLDLSSENLMSPCIDGRITDYLEWVAAPRYEPSKAGDAMHRSSLWVVGMHVAFDLHHMFLRIDCVDSSVADSTGLALRFQLLAPKPARVDIELARRASGIPATFSEALGPRGGDVWKETPALEGLQAAFGKVLEVAIPLKGLHVTAGEEIKFVMVLRENDKEKERHPRAGVFTARVPSRTVEWDLWQA